MTLTKILIATDKSWNNANKVVDILEWLPETKIRINVRDDNFISGMCMRAGHRVIYCRMNKKEDDEQRNKKIFASTSPPDILFILSNMIEYNNGLEQLMFLAQKHSKPIFIVSECYSKIIRIENGNSASISSFSSEINEQEIVPWIIKEKEWIYSMTGIPKIPQRNTNEWEEKLSLATTRLQEHRKNEEERKKTRKTKLVSNFSYSNRRSMTYQIKKLEWQKKKIERKSQKWTTQCQKRLEEIEQEDDDPCCLFTKKTPKSFGKCNATTQSGGQCKNNAIDTSGFCRIQSHRPDDAPKVKPKKKKSAITKILNARSRK